MGKHARLDRVNVFSSELCWLATTTSNSKRYFLVFILQDHMGSKDDIRDENGRKRSEEASIVFSFTFFLGNDIDNSIDGNEYGADNTGTSETKLSDRE